MFSRIKNSILGTDEKYWVIKCLYGCSDNENVLDALIISGNQAQANRIARKYLIEQVSIGTKLLYITISGVSLYINPTNPNPTKLEHVISAWAEPHLAGYQKNPLRYSDSECFFTSINLFVRAVLLAHSAGPSKKDAELFNVYELYCGPRSRDRLRRSWVRRIAGKKDVVRSTIEESFIDKCVTIKKAEFRNINGLLDIWSRPSIEGVMPGHLLLAWATPVF